MMWFSFLIFARTFTETQNIHEERAICAKKCVVISHSYSFRMPQTWWCQEMRLSLSHHFWNPVHTSKKSFSTMHTILTYTLVISKCQHDILDKTYLNKHVTRMAPRYRTIVFSSIRGSECHAGINSMVSFILDGKHLCSY